MYRITRLGALAACIVAHAAFGKAPSDSHASGENWVTYNGNLSADRFSPLDQITAQNVATLKEVGRYELPETTSFQTGPVVMDGTIFVTTATSTYAIDAVSGKLQWSHKYPAKSMGLGTPDRTPHGVALTDPKRIDLRLE